MWWESIQAGRLRVSALDLEARRQHVEQGACPPAGGMRCSRKLAWCGPFWARRVISDVAAALSGHAGHLQRRRIPDTSAALSRAAHLARRPGDAALRRISGVVVQVFQTNGLVSFKTAHNPLQSGDILEQIPHFGLSPNSRDSTRCARQLPFSLEGRREAQILSREGR
ncbi:uncharacterized protein LOC126475135 [Schistocerca serialis cubense]|uniref:uncharacterized protein LOC126475135 n=1 Tax=Schistocerca serialis cubense TaxID=2023355 RepID=UPI00214ED8E5|nr:uncharacterized protein LOC126475135 [Schistocerca serialis cubense]